MSLPSGYKRLEYIQSSGTQWIDTGFKPNQNTRIKMDCNVIGFNSRDAFLFGARIASGNTAFCLAADDANTRWFALYGNAVQNPTGTCTGKHSIDFNQNVLTLDGKNFTFKKTTFQSSYNLLLFATITNGNVDSQRGKMAIYSCQIYDNVTLIRDYIPCQTTSGEIGLWDDVNSVFYGNAGTGTFTAGAEVDPYGNDEHTLLLLHGEDLADSSPYGVAITNNGVSVSSAQSKFGGKSLYFNGSSKLYTDVPISGDCTVDFWMYVDGYPTRYPSPMNYLGSASLRGLYIHVLSNRTYFGASKDGTSINAVAVSAISSGVWHHIAVVRTGMETVFYVDGSAVATLTNSYTKNTKIYLGDLGDAPGNNFSGYIDEFRISNIARWTENFTPPTKPYSSSLNLPVNIGGTWKDANEAFVNIGGTWKTVEAAFVNIGGTWKELG